MSNETALYECGCCGDVCTYSVNDVRNRIQKCGTCLREVQAFERKED
jgi:hypothetical protein